MSVEAELAIVDDEEQLARYRFKKEHVRTDGTVKPDPFIPYRHVELSVTRHKGLLDSGIWSAGRLVSSQINRPLIGRADVQSEVFVRAGLQTIAAPLAENPNHANVTGWPEDKQAQKEIALDIAENACFHHAP